MNLIELKFKRASSDVRQGRPFTLKAFIAIQQQEDTKDQLQNLGGKLQEPSGFQAQPSQPAILGQKGKDDNLLLKRNDVRKLKDTKKERVGVFMGLQ